MTFWGVFSVTFLLGLAGAMSPGALLTYTIVKSLEAKKKAFLVGFFISLGHAIIEVILILILLAGVESFISQPTILIIIGVLGGSLLFFFGSQILLDIKNNRVDTSFLTSTEAQFDSMVENPKKRLYSQHPIFGSILFLMSNPYWWLWWATVGVSIIIENAVSLTNPTAFWGLIIGKELGVFLWYVSISTALGFSSRFMTKNVYLKILLLCALFMAGYGIYLAISPIFKFL
ncbi:LysE family transporter [Candidatus Lokiarchaeum ossiferum]|uniref:LysE family transporter n=1 Tax=Candidatus Lokiarchaeum ossiferum TaxID=2951803 RepID=UPI00352D5AF1